MMKSFLFLLIFLPTVVFSGMSRGERLERQLWKDWKAQKIDKIKKYTSKEFQSIWGQNRFSRLYYFKYWILDSYQLKNIKVTEGENSIVVSYDVDYIVKIDGGNFENTNKSLSVWKKYNHEWKWIAYMETFSFGGF